MRHVKNVGVVFWFVACCLIRYAVNGAAYVALSVRAFRPPMAQHLLFELNPGKFSRTLTLTLELEIDSYLTLPDLPSLFREHVPTTALMCMRSRVCPALSSSRR